MLRHEGDPKLHKMICSVFVQISKFELTRDYRSINVDARLRHNRRNREAIPDSAFPTQGLALESTSEGDHLHLVFSSLHFFCTNCKLGLSGQPKTKLAKRSYS